MEDFSSQDSREYPPFFLKIGVSPTQLQFLSRGGIYFFLIKLLFGCLSLLFPLREGNPPFFSPRKRVVMSLFFRATHSTDVQRPFSYERLDVSLTIPFSSLSPLPPRKS